MERNIQNEALSIILDLYSILKTLPVKQDSRRILRSPGQEGFQARASQARVDP
jgi:hypothetical protein